MIKNIMTTNIMRLVMKTLMLTTVKMPIMMVKMMMIDQIHLVESSGNLTECPDPHRPSSGLEKRYIIMWGLLCFPIICYFLLYFVKFVLLCFALHCPFSGLEKRHIIWGLLCFLSISIKNTCIRLTMFSINFYQPSCLVHSLPQIWWEIYEGHTDVTIL